VFAYQSLTAELTPLGDIGVSRLYGQYDPYKSLALDAGFRRYFDPAKGIRTYAEGILGIGFISAIDVALSAPGANINALATDVYDRTAAWSFGGNIGLLWQTSPKVGVYGQIGLRWMSGLAQIDDLGGGLQTINDGSSRWTLPIVFGVRTRF
jgi:hypothetical protein